jgi:hypothetical protein
MIDFSRLESRSHMFIIQLWERLSSRERNEFISCRLLYELISNFQGDYKINAISFEELSSSSPHLYRVAATH